MRLPQFAVPTSTESRENTGGCRPLYGRSVPFDAATLKILYPTHADYVEKVRAATAAALNAGIMVPADAALTMKAAEAAPIPDALPGLPAARPCTSRRVITLHFPRRSRGRTVTAVRVKVGNRRTVTVRSRSLRVPLIGTSAGTVGVRVTLRLKGGRQVSTVRRFKTCAAS